jgi:hypothetical protein
MPKYLFLLAAIALIGAGCASTGGSSTQSSNASGSSDVAAKTACDLFTSDIASTELGGTPKPQTFNGDTSANDTTVTTCGWSLDVGSGIASTLLVRTSDTPDAASQAFQSAKTQVSSMMKVTPEDVSGMGDSAYWVGSPLNQLDVLKGNQWLILSYLKGTKDTDRAAVTTAMQAILKKL